MGAQIVPKQNVILPVHAAGAHNMDKVGLQVSGAVIITTTGKQQLPPHPRLRIGTVIEPGGTQLFFIGQERVKIIHRNGNVNDRLCLYRGNGRAAYMSHLHRNRPKNLAQPRHGRLRFRLPCLFVGVQRHRPAFQSKHL